MTRNPAALSCAFCKVSRGTLRKAPDGAYAHPDCYDIYCLAHVDGYEPDLKRLERRAGRRRSNAG